MFWNVKSKCPITEEDRLYIEQSFSWIIDNFGREILNEDIVLPVYESFGFKFSGHKKEAFLILDMICKKMKIDSCNIKLSFYTERSQIDFGEGLVSEYSKNIELTAGKYIEYDNGEVDILIEENQLKNPISLIATIAHELAHYKLLFEKRLSENDEFVTDLITIVFGLGIFGANTSIIQMSTWANSGNAGWQIKGGAGCLHFKVWGYALAYFSFLKNDWGVKWSKYLEKDVLIAFKKSIKYLSQNAPIKE